MPTTYRFLAAAALVTLASCQTVAGSDRKQFVLISEADEKEMGITAFADMQKETPLSPDAPRQAALDRVGARISQVAAKPDFAWEYKLFDDDETVNAFCLPGGKVGVYTGIYPVALDEAGLAVIMGHEVAHALARHGAERATSAIVQQLGEAALTTAIGGLLGTNDPRILAITKQAYGMGAAVGVMLPFSRKHELEADAIGLTLMAKAGYDPKQAIEFWKRMAAKSGGAPLEFLSTHPSDASRIAELEKAMPAALELYAKSEKATSAELPARSVPVVPRPAKEPATTQPAPSTSTQPAPAPATTTQPAPTTTTPEPPKPPTRPSRPQ